IGSEGSRLRIEFAWLGDRYGHIISLIDAHGVAERLLESIEGTANDDWPPSPPLQSLSMETLTDGRRVALLVGLAGRSHWSASIEPALGKAELVFDLACRHGPNHGMLGSRYHQL